MTWLKAPNWLLPLMLFIFLSHAIYRSTSASFPFYSLPPPWAQTEKTTLKKRFRLSSVEPRLWTRILNSFLLLFAFILFSFPSSLSFPFSLFLARPSTFSCEAMRFEGVRTHQNDGVRTFQHLDLCPRVVTDKKHKPRWRTVVWPWVKHAKCGKSLSNA